MQPIHFLVLMLIATVAAWAVHRVLLSKRHKAFERLAGEWNMRYVPRDVFNLAGRIAPIFPVAGAVELRVVDLIYGIQNGRHRYLFTAEYTVDDEGGRAREVRAITVCEPQDATGPCTALVAGDAGRPLLEQYQALRDKEPPTAPPPTEPPGQVKPLW